MKRRYLQINYGYVISSNIRIDVKRRSIGVGSWGLVLFWFPEDVWRWMPWFKIKQFWLSEWRKAQPQWMLAKTSWFWKCKSSIKVRRFPGLQHFVKVKPGILDEHSGPYCCVQFVFNLVRRAHFLQDLMIAIYFIMSNLHVQSTTFLYPLINKLGAQCFVSCLLVCLFSTLLFSLTFEHLRQKLNIWQIQKAHCTNDALWNDSKVDDILTLNGTFALKIAFSTLLSTCKFYLIPAGAWRWSQTYLVLSCPWYNFKFDSAMLM